MYLKKLEISGFKSFAEATVLEFLPPEAGRFSITGVVGPNGSGKSNIVDALRWVLGEQSLKMLRGRKSEDVIFAGSEGKGKMSLAAVTITLNNADQRAPVDYEDLVITRRLYRSGESEYSLNGSSVRLLDLQLLLAQAQFGQGSYSIIGQGTIDRLLLQTPAERKNFFDEAVGIKEFQLKRHHANLKLQRTKENIAQAEVLIQEIEPHLKNLRRQVKKLEQRQEVELALREEQQAYYAAGYHQISGQVAELKNKLLAHEGNYSTVHAKLTAIQMELSALARAAAGTENFHLLQKEYQDRMEEKSDYEREKAIVGGRLQMEYSKTGNNNVAWLENKATDLGGQLAKLRVEIDSYLPQLRAQEEVSRKIRTELASLEEKRLELFARRVAVEKKIFDSEQVSDEIPRGSLRSVEAILKKKNEFGGFVYGLVAQLGRVDEKVKVALEVAASAHLSSIVVENDRVAEEGIRFLKDSQMGVATFLPLNKIRPRPIATDIARLAHEPGVYGLAQDLVKFDPKFEDIFSYVLGSTMVVDSIAVARRVGIGRVRFVTLDGDLLEMSGSMKGGYRRRNLYSLQFSSGSALNLFNYSLDEFKAELENIRLEIRALEETARQKQNDSLAARSAENSTREKINSLKEQENEKNKEIAVLEQELSLCNLDPAKYGELLKSLAVEQKEWTRKIAETEKSIQAAARNISDFQRIEEEKKKRVFELQDEMQSVQEELNAIAVVRGEAQVELARQQTKLEDLEMEVVAELKMSGASVVKLFENYLSAEGMETAKAEIEKLKYKLSLIGGIDEEVAGEYEATQKKYDHIFQELDDLKKASADMLALISELDTVMRKKHVQAFSKIKKEFNRYFSILFDGGKAELLEIYGTEERETGEAENPDDSEADEVADAEIKSAPKEKEILIGIEVTANPPGKKIKNITALSGGERTLTSLALICAVLSTNPPPFVILDEVEAALDEANTLRFNRILRELAVQSQFIIITHNRVTMHAADTLYGVTMGLAGVSKLVSVKLAESAPGADA